MAGEQSQVNSGLKKVIHPTEIILKDGFYVNWNIHGEVTIAPTTRWFAEDSDFYGDIFIARFPCEILWVAVTNSDAASANLDIEKLTGSTTKGNGDSVLASTFDMSSTTLTPTIKEANDLSATLSNRRLDTNNRLGLNMTGTLTGLRHICMSIYLKPLGKGNYR